MRPIALFFSLVPLLASSAAAQGGPPGPLQPPPAPPGNPVTVSKANLGKVLFWDEQLSSTRLTACGSCHIPSAGSSDPRSVLGDPRSTNPGLDGVFGTPDDVTGSPGVVLSLADGSYELAESFGLRQQVTGRKAPPAVDAAYVPALFWDGRADDELRDPITGTLMLASGAALENQVLGPPVSTAEMGHLGRDWAEVAARVAASAPLALSPAVPASLEAWIGGRSYPQLFQEAFGSPAVTPVRIAMAIASYERTQLSNQTPFDAFLGGNPGALTPQERQGRQIFGQANCLGCHPGNRLTDDQFHYIGVRPVNEDLGRFEVSGNPGDRGRMKTPGLRNVELRAPFFHNGRFNTLEDVVAFYNRGGDFDAPNKDPRIQALGLSPQQQAALVAFLRRPLTDPRVAAEAPPFDRPLLYLESARVPALFGQATAGSGGFLPRMVALEPPAVGNTSFTVGVEAGLAGGRAALVLDRQAVPGGRLFRGTIFYLALGSRLVDVRSVGPLLGSGAGAGYGSTSIRIPARAGLVGLEVAAQWLIADPGGPAGWSASDAALIELF